MPRTKRPVRRQEKSIEVDDTLKKLEKLAQDQKNKIDARLQMEIRNIELAFKILVGSISAETLRKTVGQLKNELYLKEPPKRTTRHSTLSRSASHDDGYLTENSSQGSRERTKKKMGIPVSTTRSIRRSRSADTTRKVPPSTKLGRPSRSVYRTPAYNKNSTFNYPTITPKVAPNTPLTVIRQPRQGEMALSLTGSPLLVSTYNNMLPSDNANCNIMLRDGTLLSVQPNELRQSQAYIPFSLMDNKILTQIKTLKDNLDKVVKLGEKALKS